MKKTIYILICAALCLCGCDGASIDNESYGTASSAEVSDSFETSVAELTDSSEDSVAEPASSSEDSQESENISQETSALYTLESDSITICGMTLPVFEEYEHDPEVYDWDFFGYGQKTSLSITVESNDDITTYSTIDLNSALNYAKVFFADVRAATPISYEDDSLAWLEYIQEMESGYYRTFAFCVYNGNTFYTLQFTCHDDDSDALRETIHQCIINRSFE